MPNPKMLKVGDRIKFFALPEEWKDPTFTICDEDVAFLETLIARTWSSRVCRIDDNGTPWIEARIRRKGKLDHHSWAIQEKTGWRLVNRLC